MVSFLVREEIGRRNYGIYWWIKKHTKVHSWPELAKKHGCAFWALLS
jgi:hypothetical protein